jgi:membrane dipeptidase
MVGTPNLHYLHPLLTVRYPFASSYVDCKPSGPDFLTATNRVRDTLEQIDIAKLMIDRYNDVFEFTTTAQGVRDAIRQGKVASLLGVEG